MGRFDSWAFSGVLFAYLVFSTACGSAAHAPVIMITTQPTAQSTRVAQSATFTVAVSGAAPFIYQWSKNGAAVSGASSASYTTPLAVAADNGSTFTVTVTNATGSVISVPAALTVGPRAPKADDWRFQGMDLPGPGASILASNMLGLQQVNFNNELATPLPIDLRGVFCVAGVNYDCSWSFTSYNLPTGIPVLTGVYKSDQFSNLTSDLDAWTLPNVVITGLDLAPSNQIFAASWLQPTQSTGFDLARQSVAPSSLQAVASQLGSTSRVITAVAFDAGQILVLSYGWQGDTRTIYEAKAITATVNDYVAQATNLAAQGYIITAVGGDPVNGLVLVGTRVQGDTLARPFAYQLPVLPSNIQSLNWHVADSSVDASTWLTEQ